MNGLSVTRSDLLMFMFATTQNNKHKSNRIPYANANSSPYSLQVLKVLRMAFHHLHKLFEVNRTIVVHVSLANDLNNIVVGHYFTHGENRSTKLIHSDGPIIVCVDELKDGLIQLLAVTATFEVNLPTHDK